MNLEHAQLTSLYTPHATPTGGEDALRPSQCFVVVADMKTSSYIKKKKKLNKVTHTLQVQDQGQREGVVQHIATYYHQAKKNSGELSLSLQYLATECAICPGFIQDSDICTIGYL